MTSPMYYPVPPDDALDAQLGEFFRKEMPNPWPPFRQPALVQTIPFHPVRRPARWLAFRSRLALAASVALLLIGGMLLPTRLIISGKPPLPDNGKGNRERLVDPDKDNGGIFKDLK